MSLFSGLFLSAYSKLIMDPVHGGIPLLSHEVLVIDHPLFQRLRAICQNDILSLVFPGATHSRFLHSIGVMHVGNRMFQSLVESYLQQRDIANKDNINAANEIPDKLLSAIDYFNKIIRLGCLLHDSGHSSFSHQFNKTQKITDLMSYPDRFQSLWAGINIENLYPELPKILEHEHYSVRCAWEIFDHIQLEKFGIYRYDVLGIMETTRTQFSSLFYQHALNFWQFITHTETKNNNQNQPVPENIPEMVGALLSSIISGEVDADRADYMLRDGFHSSVMIGGFNLDHLLSNLRFGWDLKTPWLGLAITQKGLGSLEDFVFSRYQMYRQVYAHKTALGFDWLLREAINEVLENPEVYKYVDQCLSKINEFGQLTDSYFWELFRTYGRNRPKSFSRCIIERTKLQHITTLKDLSYDQKEHYRQKLANQLSVNADNVVTCSMQAHFSNISDNFTTLKVLVKDPISHHQSLKNITEVSTFFSKFHDGIITHFYKKPF